ncbi:MAG: hemerythrin domain-containing protein, partial [Candidatus Kapaibacteriota bacterium]
MNELYITILMNDHSIIEKTLVILERQLQKKKKNWSTIQTLIDILWDYGETCHNMKEENVYFPLLLQRGMPEQGPVAVMLQEHQYERTYLQKFKSFLSKTDKTLEEINDFISEFQDYANLTKDHIWKENDILYPMGRRFILPEDVPYLANEFKRL